MLFHNKHFIKKSPEVKTKIFPAGRYTDIDYLIVMKKTHRIKNVKSRNNLFDLWKTLKLNGNNFCNIIKVFDEEAF